jgi:hypothetical protein
MGVSAGAAEGVCVFHERIEKRVEEHDREIGEIKVRLATGNEKFVSIHDCIGEIKKRQNWSMTFTIGTLVAVIINFVFK